MSLYMSKYSGIIYQEVAVLARECHADERDEWVRLSAVTVAGGQVYPVTAKYVEVEGRKHNCGWVMKRRDLDIRLANGLWVHVSVEGVTAQQTARREESSRVQAEKERIEDRARGIAEQKERDTNLLRIADSLEKIAKFLVGYTK